MALPKDVDLVTALLLLKREFMKAAGIKALPTIVVAHEEVAKIARSIDPNTKIYPDPVGASIKFAGMDIVSDDIV